MGQRMNASRLIQNLREYLEQIPLFLLTLPLFLLVHIEGDYRHLITYRFVYKVILELIVAPFFIWGIAYLAIRNYRKSALWTLLFLLIFYFFCDLKDWLHELSPGYFFEKYSFLLPAISVILAYASIEVKRSRATFKKWYLFINILLIIFIVTDCLRIISDSPLTKNDLGDRKKSVSFNYSACTDCIRPDIYYIIFDAYTSSKTLQTEFNYNNQALESFLQEKQFFTVQNSKSNYNLTPFSIASCFNLNYLQHFDPRKKIHIKEYLPGLHSVFASELTRIFEKEGYEIKNHSVFDIKKYPTTDSPNNMWSIDLIYKRHNIFRKINTDIGWLIKKHLKIKGVTGNDIEYIEQKDLHYLKSLKSLMHTAVTPSPKPRFVYGHLVLPHLPSAFDSLGNKVPLSVEPLNEEENREKYIQLVNLSNKTIKNIIDSILLNAKRPVVIIIQGDHGYLFRDTSKKELEFANLNTMYFSTQNYSMLHDSLSNVNTFRIILNTFFKKKYPLLKDTSYFLHHK